MPTTITPATKSDATTLSAIASQTFTLANPADADHDQLASYIACAHVITAAAARADAIAGFIVLRYQASTRLPEEAEHCAELQRLYVLPDHHGGGIAGKLVEAALETCRLQGFAHIRLSVFSGNQWAKKFYEKYGFKTVAETDFVMGRERHRDVIMVAEVD